jgi:hypothetical protein
MIKPEDELSFVVRSMPDSCTRSAYGFAIETIKLMRFSWFTLSSILDNSRKVKIVEVLSKYGGGIDLSDEDKDVIVQIVNSLERMESENTEVFDFEAELFLCRMADNYMIYLRDIISEIYMKVPNMLRSSEQVTYDFVLQHSNMADLISSMAERKVNELSYKGLKEFEKYCERNGLQLFSSEEFRSNISLILEIRNIITHNRGVISGVFKRRIPNHPLNIGDNISYASEQFHDDSETMVSSVFDIDARVVGKFGLDLVPLRSSS